jgi:hypothetical protein
MTRKILLLSAVLLTGCFQMKSANNGGAYAQSVFLPGDGSIAPASDRLASDCQSNSAYDTCLYQKNPVAQQGVAADVTQAQGLRLYGVKLHGLDGSGFLQNSQIQVFALKTPRLTLLPVGKFKAVYDDGQSYAEQLSAYYWTNLTLEYLQAHYALKLSRPLLIYADDAFTGFGSADNSIHLEKKSGTWPKAFSGEVVVHLLGEALAYDLSAKNIFPGANAQHNLCLLNPRGCCASSAGCSQALASAFGDYVAAMVFPERPRLGETLANSTAGQSICSTWRDLASLSAQTKDGVYNACSDKGNATLTGAWYASLWWSVRQQQEQTSPGSGADIDNLFISHAKAWTATSTFNDAKTAALQLATQYKSGKYLSALTTALSEI